MPLLASLLPPHANAHALASQPQVVQQPKSPSAAWTLCTLIAVSVLGISQAACRRFVALPLDAKAKASALAPPDLARVEIQAMELRHPILKPLRINFSDGLSPEEAAVVAVVANPDLRALRDQRALAAAQLLDAGLLPDPVLSYAQDVPAGANGPGFVTARTTQLSLDLTGMLTRGLRRRTARSEQRAVDLEVAWGEWQVAEAAKLSVHRIRSLESMTALGDEAAKLLADDLQAVEKSAASGGAPIGDVAAMQAAYDAGRRNALTLRQLGDHERQTLNALLGLAPDTQVPLEHPQGKRAWSGMTSEKDLVAGLDRRLDLVALQHGYESQDARLRLAIWSQFPNIGLSLSRATDTSNVLTHGFGVALSLPIFNRGQGAVAVAEATRQQLLDQYQARLFHARQDLGQILSDLQVAARMIAAAEGALPALAAQAEAADAAFKKGTLDLLGRNQAWLALLAQRGSVAGLHLYLDDLGVALETVAGRILPPHLPAEETSK